MKLERLDRCDYCHEFVSTDYLAIVDIPHPPFTPIYCCRDRCQRHAINMIRSGYRWFKPTPETTPGERHEA